jgi:2-haloacid dehalogenase
VSDRWATFDCYGTLIDWNGGIASVLARFFGRDHAPRLLERYHQIEPELERDGTLSYREVLTAGLAQLAREESLPLAAEEEDALARSLPAWTPFPEVRASLEEARRRGWRLAVLSNTDRDYIDASLAQIGVPFDEVVVASEIRSYKPAHGHWDTFFERTGARRARHVHVAASLFHDARPARELGLPFVWINRLGEPDDVGADRELPDLGALPEALDDLVPA